MSVQTIIIRRKTNNLIVEDEIKYKNGVPCFGMTRIIKKILSRKEKIDLIKKTIKLKIDKTYRKVLNLIMKYKHMYHLHMGRKYERKAQKHYNKYVDIKHRFEFFNMNRINFKLWRIKVRK